ncbi:MAG: helix-turn-helix transcriptional regulator [Lachnospiraceae bacterium]|nr:helix-turn-helix transcriptional regulator [Lachnospiraceae bacterium]
MKRLKALRMDRNISQQKLADALGISQQAIHKYEHDKAQPDIGTLIQLSQYFHVSVDYLIENTGFDSVFVYSGKDQSQKTMVEFDLTPSEYHYISLFRALSPKTQKSIIHILEVMTSGSDLHE